MTAFGIHHIRGGQCRDELIEIGTGTAIEIKTERDPDSDSDFDPAYIQKEDTLLPGLLLLELNYTFNVSPGAVQGGIENGGGLFHQAGVGDKKAVGEGAIGH